jgi:hypothetical protein
MAWTYQREEQKFEVLPEGKYRVRIKEAEKQVSKSGNDMLVLQLEVSGTKKVIYNYIVFMPSKPEIANGKLTQFFDSFKGIEEGDLDTAHWIGKVGAAMIKHDEYNGEKREKISYFIKREKQDDLPDWIEPDGLKYETVSDADDMPF